MITNFALSLSFEGIELLHRVRHGWKRVGTADVEDKNLDKALADLRAKAERLAPDGLRTKLIIPLDQIKYIAIDSTQTTQDDIHATLDGATPYALDELVIDCERFGGRTHIAAVARETLSEAEAFAHAHGFNPVSFVAIPEPFTFQKEVFFGPTSMMQDILGFGAEVDRDPIPVMIVGTRIRSRLLVFDLPEDAIPPSDEFDLAAALAPHVAADVPAPDDDASLPPSQGFDLAAALAPHVADDIAKATEQEPVVAEPAEEEEPPVAAVVEEIEDTVAEDVSLAAADVADQDVLDAPVDEVVEAQATPAKPAVQIYDRVIAEYHPPVVEYVVAQTPVETVRLIPDAPVFANLPLFDPVIPEVLTGQRRKVAKPATFTATAPGVVAGTPKLGGAKPLSARQPTPANETRKPVWIAGAIAASLALVGVIAWSQLGSDTAAPLDDVAAIETVPEDVVVAEDVTAIAEQIPAPTPEPAVIEVVEAAPDILLVEVAGFASPTAETIPDTRALIADAPLRRVIPAPVAPPATADALPAPVQMPPEPPAEELAVAEVGAPVLRGRVLSPADATRIYEATGVWQRAPRFVDVPSTTSTDGLIIPFSETVPGRLVQPDIPAGDGLETDLSFLAPADPPPADVAFPRDADGFILATPEGTVTPDGAVVIAGAPENTGQLRPALTQADLARMALLAPAPEGVVIIAGPPPTVPPLRPADAALPEPEPETDVAAAIAAEVATQDTVSPGGVALSNIQPDETGALVVITDPENVDIRPQPRPSALASTASVADPGTPDITSIIAGIEEETPAIEGATEQAVVASLRPEGRPTNFATVVANARARQAAPQPAPAAPVQTAAPVAPQNFAPVPGGVARAATQEDVIRLREINLIGVYGRPNGRRALVRLSNGRYVRVEVGSALDGGQVTAIGESALNYVKRGRTIALELPSG